MIEFIEHHSENYQARTVLNVIQSDITLAIASNFSTSGEILTKRTCKNYNKKYVAMHLHFQDFVKRSSHLGKIFNNKVSGDIILNIAGNGIYSTDKSQEDIDKFVYSLLYCIHNDPLLNFKIIEIITGGQTGVDEAGAKAGDKLNIPTKVRCPKGWKFRDKNKVDISDEKLFKQRFL